MSINRRDFLKMSGIVGGGLLVGMRLFGCKSENSEQLDPAAFEQLEMNAFIKINGDGTATLIAKNPEIGQGVRTSLPMMLAEELDLPWEKIKVEEMGRLDARLAPQFAGGSMSTPLNYMVLRQAGAAVRTVLVMAAAAQWNVPVTECKTENGFIVHGEKKLHYGKVAEAAAKLELPKEPVLKAQKDFTIIGKSKTDVDMHKIVTGKPVFGLDQHIDGMLFASILKPDVFGSTVVSFNADEAKKVAGVIDVIQIKGLENPTDLLDGVAVIATNTWAAFKAKKLLTVEWKKPAGYVVSMEALFAQMGKEALKGTVLRKDGDVDKVFKSSKNVHEAVFEVPFLSHSQMEPMNFIADVKEGSVRLLGPTQTPGGAARLASQITGIDAKNITVEFTRIGGGFGRRLTNDYAAEAVYLSHQLKKPVKVVWTRENDFQADYYRPAGSYRLRAALDGKTITAFEANVCTTSRKMYRLETENIHETEAFPDQQPAGMVPNFRVTYKGLKTNVPVGALRTPGANATTFVFQCFLDELAEKAGMDPIDFHLNYIGTEARDMPYRDHGGPVYNTGRLRKVIELAREKSGWDTPAPQGRFRGFSGQMVFGVYVAQVVEVSLNNGKIKVEKVTCTADCGLVINPVGADAQVQGGITDAISAALYESISLNDGALVEQNFHQYQKLRFSESPTDIAVHFVPSDASPIGLGEPSYPVLFAALANAVSKATGQRVRQLPLKKLGLA